MLGDVRPARLEDVAYLAPRLRSADIAELKAALGLPPEPALRAAVENPSITALVGLGASDEPVVIFGSSPAGPGVGLVWMLATEDLLKYRLPFLRRSRRWVETLHEQYPVLTNWVDARNELHIRWLGWLGFQFLRLEPFGVESRPFYEIIKVCAPQQSPSPL